MTQEDCKPEKRIVNQDDPASLMSGDGPLEKTGLFTRHLPRCRDLIQRHLIAPLSLSNNPPWYDARGAAIGFIVALGVPIGGHTVALALLLPLVRYNFAIAFAVTWIVNPFTVVPLYYGYYYLGSLVLGDSTVMGIDGFRKEMAPVLNAGSFLEALRLFISLDLRILERWMVTAAAVSTLSAALGYVAAYLIQTNRKKTRAFKK